MLTVAGGVPVWTSVNSTWPQGTIYGLTLSQASPTTVGITIGGCANEYGGTGYNIVLGSAITKGLGGWTTGSGNGGLDTGSVAANAWYHVHLIRKDSDGSIDALLSLSATTPTVPAGYTARRRLGSIRTNASSQITSFIQRGDEFIWSVPILDRNSNSASDVSLLTLSVPSGIQVKARLLGFTLASTGNSVSMAILSPDIPSQTPTDLGSASTGVAPMPNIASAYNGGAWSSGSAEVDVWTSTSSQVNVCVRSSGTAGVIAIQTNGWIDTRGKL
ncbi:hypothetical protein ACN6KF_004927 [Labrys sp. La1]|uniref:hypothetical protein n=1 Tax=Labrys sp. La1 TaxID=3404917 RepID=UPI003EB70C12